MRVATQIRELIKMQQFALSRPMVLSEWVIEIEKSVFEKLCDEMFDNTTGLNGYFRDGTNLVSIFDDPATNTIENLYRTNCYFFDGISMVVIQGMAYGDIYLRRKDELK